MLVAPEPARAGRRRSAKLDELLLGAAAELLLAKGYARMAMRDVAARAGVSKMSLYRRWPTKLDLVMAMIHEGAPRVAVPDLGKTSDDIFAYLMATLRAAAPRSGLMSSIATEAMVNSELAEVYRSALVDPWRADLFTIINRGVQRDELPASTDIELLSDAIQGLLLTRSLMTGSEASRALAGRIVNQFFSQQ